MRPEPHEGNEMIKVEGLGRDFDVTVREPGLASALRSVVHRRTRTISAISNVSFTAYGGSVLGFLGPNGSGKTTTLKCLAGLLTPTAGSVDVLGHTPHRRDPGLLRRLGFVMGQRWQLHVDLPVAESFDLHRVVYGLEADEFRRNRAELVDLLGLQTLLTQPARKLSLGQRMRCEFAAALMHRPSVVLLDEPTLGLDFEAQLQIRRFVGEYVRLTGACVLLTSHYLADIEALCADVMTISGGQITFHGPLAELRAMAGTTKRVTARLSRPVARTQVEHVGAVIEHDETSLVIEVENGQAGAAVTVLEGIDGVTELSLADPPLEDTLRGLYSAPAAVPAVRA